MPDFDYFVVFAEMRTGSNFFEDSLNRLDGVSCHGEAYNPTFIGTRELTELFDVTMVDREAEPFKLLDRIKSADGMNGFRFFNDHDPRILDTMLADPRCAKIILTRNPVESYVSLQIAVDTDLWQISDVKDHQQRPIKFSPWFFNKFVETLQNFQLRLLNTLQKSGQTAFYIDYEDLQDIDVLNGLAKFLGVDSRLDSLGDKFIKQNANALSDKVSNFAEMEDALAAYDRFSLTRTPNFEPRRGPVVPTYVLPPQSSLMFLPIDSGPTDAVSSWLAGLDEVKPTELMTQLNQSALRKWKRENVGHRCFTVVRHPVARAHAAFVDVVLSADKGHWANVREMLLSKYKLPIPVYYPDAEYDQTKHKLAFKEFLKFIKANLTGQTGVRVNSNWATQQHIIQGFSQFAVPDFIMREDRLEDDLAIIAAQIGKTAMPNINGMTDPHAELLSSIYDDEIEKLTKKAYQRDYETFGFDRYQL